MIERTIMNKLIGELEKPFVSVLIGPRQVGKTILMKMIGERTGLNVTHLDLENPLDTVVLRDGMTSLLNEVGDGRRVILFDEFHRYPDALKLFKQLQDARPDLKMYASGSSSIEVHAHLRESAVGRVRRTRIFPLSFPEWCAGRCDIDLLDHDPKAPLPPRASARLDSLLAEFTIWGGMPELAGIENETERREALQDICALYLEKDVRSLLRDEDILRFNEFLRLLSIRLGQMMNKSEIGRELGITARHVEKSLLVMAHTFVYRPVTTDYANPTKRLVKAPKIYWYDNGVRNSLVKDFRGLHERPDGGQLLENHVFNELDKAAGVDTEVHFHRTKDGQEIDFVLERDRQKLLVEVKSTLTRPTVPRAIRDLLGRDDTVGAAVLNKSLHRRLDLDGKPVFFLPPTLAHTVPGLLRQLT